MTLFEVDEAANRIERKLMWMHITVPSFDEKLDGLMRLGGCHRYRRGK